MSRTINKYLINPPKLVKKIFPTIIWESKVDKILMTFDDGPNPGTTERILKILSDQNLKVVFFAVGNNIKRYNSLASEIISEGHLLEHHTFNHLKVTKLHEAEIRTEIGLFNNEIKKLDNSCRFFRPPYGRISYRSKRIIEKNRLKVVMWSLLTYDYKNDLNIVKFTTRYLAKNSIVVLHDSQRCDDIIEDSIKYLCEDAAKKGFTFGEPSECLK